MIFSTFSHIWWDLRNLSRYRKPGDVYTLFGIVVEHQRSISHLPSGYLTVRHGSHGLFIDGLPFLKMVIFHGYVTNNQMVKLRLEKIYINFVETVWKMIYEWWVFHIYVSITVFLQAGNHQKRSTKRFRKQLHPRASPGHSSPRKIHEPRAKTKENGKE